MTRFPRGLFALGTPRRSLALALATAAILGAGACSPQYVRDTDDPALDTYTMSLRLDRADLDRLYRENVEQLLSSAVARAWERQAAVGPQSVVAVFPMRNETSEHISPQLDALLSKFETDLVNKTSASVVSYENQPSLIAEIKRQQSDAYDPQRLAQYGKQLGAQFFVTGKVYDVAERDDGERRVQYFMFVQVIEVETGQIRFQHESKLTKGLMR